MKAHWIFALLVIGVLTSLPGRACETRNDIDVSTGCGDSQCIVQTCIDSPGQFGGLQGNLYSLPALPSYPPLRQSVIIKALPFGWNGNLQYKTPLTEAARFHFPGDITENLDITYPTGASL